jgi:hypothetical protein
MSDMMVNGAAAADRAVRQEPSVRRNHVENRVKEQQQEPSQKPRETREPAYNREGRMPERSEPGSRLREEA